MINLLIFACGLFKKSWLRLFALLILSNFSYGEMVIFFQAVEPDVHLADAEVSLSLSKEKLKTDSANFLTIINTGDLTEGQRFQLELKTLSNEVIQPYTLVYQYKQSLSVYVKRDVEDKAQKTLKIIKVKGIHEILVEYQSYYERYRKESIGKSEFDKYANIFDDPVAVNRVFAHNTATSPLIGDFFIRGSYRQNYFLDYAPVHGAYHLFNLTSILSGDLVKEMDIYPSGGDVDSVSAFGLQQDIFTDDEQKKRITGSVEIGAQLSGAYFNIPMGDKWTMVLAGRRTYIDLILGDYINQVAPVNFTTLPAFWDLYGKLVFRPNASHKLSLSGFWAGDKAAFKIDDSGEAGSADIDTFTRDTEKTTAFGSFTHLYTPSRKFQNRITAYYSYQAAFEDEVSQAANQARTLATNEISERNFDTVIANVNNHIYWRATDWLDLTGGVGYQNWKLVDREKIESYQTNGGGNTFDSPIVDNSDSFNLALAYVKGVFHTGPVDIDLGLRYEYIPESGNMNFMPRGGLIYSIIESKLASFLNYGRYSTTLTRDRIIDSDQVVFGFDITPKTIYGFKVSGFYHYYKSRKKIDFREFFPDDPGNRFDNSNNWYIGGFELDYEHTWKKLFWRISYGYNYVYDLDAKKFHRMDKPLILKAVFNYRPFKQWTISLLQEVYSGERYTPKNDADDDGKMNSERLPTMHFLSLETEYSWELKRGKISLSLKLINLYASKIYQTVAYPNSGSGDYRTKKFEESGFPSGFPFGDLKLRYEF